jgi:hypothetical protein
MTASTLKLEHHCGQAFVCDLIPDLFLVLLGDLKVLAIDAAEIAITKKDITRTACASKRRFFAEVRRKRGHNGQAT